jgi:hypothetical protein
MLGQSIVWPTTNPFQKNLFFERSSEVFQEVSLTDQLGTVPIQFQYSNAVHGPEGLFPTIINFNHFDLNSLGQPTRRLCYVNRLVG